MFPHLDAAPLEDAGEAVAEVEVGGRDGAAEGELEEGVVAFPLLLPLVAAEGAADPEGAAPAVVDEVTVSVSPASCKLINFVPYQIRRVSCSPEQ